MSEKMLDFEVGWRDPKTEHVGQCKLLFLLLGTCTVMKRWFALAVEEVPETPDTYKRIGIASNDCSGCEGSEMWFDNAERRTIYLI